MSTDECHIDHMNGICPETITNERKENTRCLKTSVRSV